MAAIAGHSTFGPIIRAIPPELLAAQSAQSRSQLQRAIEEGEWGAYDAHLVEQGVMYARIGVTFEDWYDLIRVVSRSLVPRIVSAYAGEPQRLALTLLAMQDFLDGSMAVIGSSYIASKESAQRDSEQKLAITLDSIGDGVIATDTEGRVEWLNPVAERLTGWTRAESVGRPLTEVFRIEDEDTGEAVVNPAQRVLAQGAVGLASHTVLVSRAGVRRPILDSAAPIRAAGGDIRGVVLVFRDMADQRAAERERSRVETQSRLKSEFLANMSHELRTPLNAVIGFSELLHDGRAGPVTAKQVKFLGHILTSGRHLLELINDVLDLSKVEAGKLEFHPESVEVGALVAEVTANLETAAASRRVRIETAISPEIGVVMLDAARFKQVLYNYLSNALKFSPEGGAIAVRVLPAGPEAFRLEVEDDGIGIPPQHLQRLFVEFEQLDAGAAKSYSGTGLGLALTRRLVEAQGGTVGVESVLGEGSCFFAVFPHPRDPGRIAVRTAPPVESRRPGSPMVLVVEDDPRDQEAITRALTDAGYGVQIAATGARAVALTDENTYDAITLDLILPDMSGLDALRTIREARRNSQVPVVIITVVAGAMAAGFAVSDVLAKPLDNAALLAALRRVDVVPGAHGTVMVVDDDPAALALMTEALEQLHYRSACFHDGEAALRALATETPDAIILDLLMPDLNGFQFLGRLRGSPLHRGVPVLIWTIKDLDPDELQELRVTAQAVVQKGDGVSPVVEELRNNLLRRTPEARDHGG